MVPLYSMQDLICGVFCQCADLPVGPGHPIWGFQVGDSFYPFIIVIIITIILFYAGDCSLPSCCLPDPG